MLTRMTQRIPFWKTIYHPIILGWQWYGTDLTFPLVQWTRTCVDGGSRVVRDISLTDAYGCQDRDTPGCIPASLKPFVWRNDGFRTYAKCICLLAAVYVSFEYFTSVQYRVYTVCFGSTWHGFRHRWGGVMKSNWFKKWHYISAPFHIVKSIWEVDHIWSMDHVHTLHAHKNHVIYNVYRFPGHIRPKNHRHKKLWPSVVCRVLTKGG